ncbi:MAG: Y-family DNA polymerase [Actinomycetaceae bacterium]|nr:Y-family DNA polymerase [Actinomycetaceae bacterium]
MKASGEMTAQQMVALVDCENFYASCERIFYPALLNKPVVVLSNNDGCVVAASSEAKTLDPQIMGKPWFQIEQWSHRNGVIARSSNYELYGSISARVMSMIARFSIWQEVYSIDESFIGLRGNTEELIALGHKMRREIYQGIGVPVRVSIGTTKTLAKFASIGAKKATHLDGVCHLGAFTPAHLAEIMRATPVTELWGVGRRLGKRLAALNINTVWDLRQSDPITMRKRFSVIMQRTILELRGTPCISQDVFSGSYKGQLMYSRSFSYKITTVREMQQVLPIYVQRASKRLRAAKQLASQITVWAATSWADTGSAHAPSFTVNLPIPSDDPIVLGRAAQGLIEHIKPGMRYARAGVVLSSLSPKRGQTAMPLFGPEGEDQGIGRTIDAITSKYGEGVVGIGRGGMKQPAQWEMKRAMLSKRATTHWSELAIAKAE